MPHLQQGAKVIGKKALQTGVNVPQDVLDGDNIKKAISKRAKQALGLPAQNSLQGHKRLKNQSPPDKKAKTSPQAKKPKKGNLTEFFDKE